MAVGILIVLEDGVASTSSVMVQDIAVILEEAVVLEDVPDLPNALTYFWADLSFLTVLSPLCYSVAQLSEIKVWKHHLGLCLLKCR